MAKIKIGMAALASTMAAQIENAGFQFGSVGDKPVLTVKFPGLDSIDLGFADLTAIVDRLDAPRVTGSDPAAVFCRTATEDESGMLAARFSDAPRARSLSFTNQDRIDVSNLLDGHLKKWQSYCEALAAAEAEAAKVDEK